MAQDFPIDSTVLAGASATADLDAAWLITSSLAAPSSVIARAQHNQAIGSQVPGVTLFTLGVPVIVHITLPPAFVAPVIPAGLRIVPQGVPLQAHVGILPGGTDPIQGPRLSGAVRVGG